LASQYQWTPPIHSWGRLSTALIIFFFWGAFLLCIAVGAFFVPFLIIKRLYLKFRGADKKIF
jgi:hypothetical protein